MNLHRIFDSFNKDGDLLSISVAFRNCPEKKIGSIRSEIERIFKDWNVEDDKTVEFGKSDISVAKDLGWGLEESVHVFRISTERSLDISPDDLQEWTDSMAQKLGERVYIYLKVLPVDILLVFSYRAQDGQIRSVDSHYVV